MGSARIRAERTKSVVKDSAAEESLPELVAEGDEVLGIVDTRRGRGLHQNPDDAVSDLSEDSTSR